jgi:hypothetical protein
VRFKYAVAVGAATALAGLGAAAAPAAAARNVPFIPGARPAIAHKIRGSILAGYAVEKATSVTSATTSFKIPALTCPAAASSFVNENFEIGAPSSTPGTVAKGLAVTFVGTCHGSTAVYLGIVAFPPAKRIKELSAKVAAGDKITITIAATKSSGTVTVTTAGHKQTMTSPGFAATFALADVIVTPPVAHTGPKWTRVRFADTQLNNKSLGSFSPTRIDAATVKKQVLAVPSKLQDSGTAFVIRYRA